MTAKTQHPAIAEIDKTRICEAADTLTALKSQLTETDREAAEEAETRALTKLLPHGYEIAEPSSSEKWAAAILAISEPQTTDETLKTIAAVFQRPDWYPIWETQPGTCAWTYDIPDRKWLIENWLPADSVTLLAGLGGLGKSRLAWQLCYSLASSIHEWLGKRENASIADIAIREPVPVLYISWEDDQHELARRLPTRIKQDAVGYLEDRLHAKIVQKAIWEPDPTGSKHTSTLGVLTDLGRMIDDYAAQIGAALVVLDPLAAAYALNENDRALVRAFLSDRQAACRRDGYALIILSHPPKNEAAYSGSTDWWNGVRTVWTLGLEETPASKQARAAVAKNKPEPILGMALDRPKSNYGKPTETIWLASDYPEWKACTVEESVESLKLLPADVVEEAKRSRSEELLYREE